jgi:hypothetical protein
VVFIERHFAREDLAEFAENVLKFLTVTVLVNLAHEDVLTAKLGNVGTEELVGERKSAAGFALNVEVTESLGNFAEARLIVDLDDSLVERLVEVATDLRNTIKIVAGLFLDDLGEAD